MNKISPNLCLSPGAFYPVDESPEEYLNDKVYISVSNQVALGLEIENHSDFDLRDGTTDLDDCSATRNLRENDASDVLADSKAMFIFDNGLYKDYGLCGSISWQIFYKNGNPLLVGGEGKRFLVTFRVPYR